ncbi:hypothetical protein [Enterococcus sp. BWR-S5]|uniref:hypothetical protein n=1 Tax=Enterococcus sp. BWR-S5 TaxID=2787714 RepID=UPI001924142A|nr:hypothetical protein [Enterococcus sp. BWR-S5]MBL1225073.1 hypothetical protein [Enterococcus sp. BWR-S5]
MDFYCKMFVQTPLTKTELVGRLAQEFGWQFDAHFSTENDYLSLDIRDNEEFDTTGLNKEATGFLFFRYFFDIELLDERKVDEYKEQVARVIYLLQDRKCLVVTACSFEEELPKSGKCSF